MGAPKHTPGPWTILPASNGNTSSWGLSLNIKEFVDAYNNDAPAVNEDMSRANARLIAAAPEMYQLLHQLWAKLDPTNRDCRIIAELLDRIEDKSTGGAK